MRHGLACEYLENTQLPLLEIAHLVGFDEPGNFTHAFKRWSGRTPSAYRAATTSWSVGSVTALTIGAIGVISGRHTPITREIVGACK